MLYILLSFFKASLHLPQSSGPLLLVDINEIAHHTALDHISLSLHADLGGQKEVNVTKLNLKRARVHKRCVTLQSQLRGVCISWASTGI